MGKRKEKTRPLKLNLKQILLGSSKEKIVPGSRFPNGTQSMVPVVELRRLRYKSLYVRNVRILIRIANKWSNFIIRNKTKPVKQ